MDQIAVDWKSVEFCSTDVGGELTMKNSVATCPPIESMGGYPQLLHSL